VNGTFSSPALSLSPITNYTYKLIYYNGSKSVLSSNASGTNVVFSGTPSGFTTLTVASTTTTSTTTTTTSINWFYVLLAVIVLLIIAVAIVAGSHGAKHAIESQVRKYVKEGKEGYVTEG
jgi:glucan phosphoethanolaminetransferase (alkaline phosphatase superfamily)